MNVYNIVFINTKNISDSDIDKCLNKDLNIEEWQTEDSYELRFIVNSWEERIKIINHLLKEELITEKEYDELKNMYSLNYIILYH